MRGPIAHLGRFRTSRTGLFATFGVIIAVASTSGCAKQNLVIEQDKYINTAPYSKGEPLEVNVVLVTAKDLELDGNSRLAPDSDITADVWYESRPKHGDEVDSEESHNRFRLPAKQVLVFSERQEEFYGSWVGPLLRGAEYDRKSEYSIEFEFPGNLNDKKSVVYVFPRFIGKEGQTLPTKPAKFNPPGKYVAPLRIRIGVEDGRGSYGQFVDIRSGKK